MTDLKTLLTDIDWTTNIVTSLGSGSTLEQMEAAALRIAIWSKQLEEVDEGNPALCFVREMQHAIQHSNALIGLCLYKPSASCSRTLVESCIYYTYFRTHIEELATLTSDKRYYVSKSEVIDYHKQHTANFKNHQEKFNLVGRLDTWYSRVSAVVHGQIPGSWNTHSALSQTSYAADVHALALTTLLEGVSIVNDILLCTVVRTLWKGFAPEAKKYLIKGMEASKRDTLSLDRQ